MLVKIIVDVLYNYVNCKCETYAHIVIQSFHSDCMNDFCCMVVCVVRSNRG